MRTYHHTTARLGLGLWTAGDIQQALDLWDDPEVTRYFGGPYTREQVQERLDREVRNLAFHGIQYWPLYRLSDGDFVGCCGLKPHPDEGVLELGFHLRPVHWRQGYAPEAARLAMALAFTQFGAQGLFAGHHPQNEGSRKVLEGLGFRFVGTDYFPPTGLDHLSYRLSREEWTSNQ